MIFAMAFIFAVGVGLMALAYLRSERA